MLFATFMYMFVKLIGTFATFAFADMIIGPTTKLLPGFTRIGFLVTHVTNEEI